MNRITGERTRIPAFLLVTVLVFGLIMPVSAEYRVRTRKSMPFVVLGIGCVAGGVAVSVLEYSKAKEAYSDYRKSAFTDNTEKLRRDVRKHDRYSLIGAFVAGIGALTIVVNF